MKRLVLIGLAFLLTGCAGANISSQTRESGHDGSNMMLRCVYFQTDNEALTNEKLKQYDGWKMVYVSEYTTSNKTDSAIVICFEKQVQ